MEDSKDTNLENLLKILPKSFSEDDISIIKKAYNLASQAHKKQTRASGKPYMVHPLWVATYLAQNQMDSSTIAAALLHDVVEDTNITIDQVQKEFGEKIAKIVDGLTKLEKVKIKKSWLYSINPLEQNRIKQKEYENHLENLRKMFIAVTEDQRIIFVKLADRLHNMQTLGALSKDRQKRISEETIMIYAPIAHRLGMGKIKGQLEDLAFYYLYPEEYNEVKKIFLDKYLNIEKYLESTKQEIKNKLEEHDIKVVDIHGRKKHLYSFYKKLKKYHDVNKIYDIVAIRIIVNSTEDCYKSLGIIHQSYRPLIGRIKDYIAMPKPNGYQSLHTTVFGPEGNIIEIQIRTVKMHEKAEHGLAAHWHYSEHNKQSEIISKKSFTWINELAKYQKNIEDNHEWSEILRLDFFKDRIFAFTPKGDVYDLPLGATPVDFAYAIHTDIGNMLKGSKVNSKIVKLNYQLQNGDIVEIITSKKSTGPKRDWLKFVKTSKAKDKIKSQFFSKS